MPQDDAGNITEDTAPASGPSIQYCLDNGAAVMVTSHLGRPLKQYWSAPTTPWPPVAVRLGQSLHPPGAWCPTLGRGRLPKSNWARSSCSGRTAAANKGAKDNEELAKKMAALCDVHERRFGTAHRAEPPPMASPFAPVACAGILMGAEIDASARPPRVPANVRWWRPSAAKVLHQLTIFKSLALVDQLIVGGGIATTFLLASGKRIGESLAEPESHAEAQASWT